VPDLLPAGHVYAGDIGRAHLGKLISADGVTGVLREFGHIDSELTQLLIGDRIVTLAAGRPVAIELP
jgi:hypothetical protein